VTTRLLFAISVCIPRHFEHTVLFKFRCLFEKFLRGIVTIMASSCCSWECKMAVPQPRSCADRCLQLICNPFTERPCHIGSDQPIGVSCGRLGEGGRLWNGVSNNYKVWLTFTHTHTYTCLSPEFKPANKRDTWGRNSHNIWVQKLCKDKGKGKVVPVLN
jgi:hypothetical protein